MFRWVLGTLVLVSFLVGPAAADPARSVLPFDPVGLDGQAPPAPTGLSAELDDGNWIVSWDAVYFDGTGLGYVVYIQSVGEVGNHDWDIRTIDGDTTEIEFPATAALVTLTVTSRAGGHESAATEYLVMGAPLPAPLSCVHLRVWLQPPPPGAEPVITCLG